MHYKSGAERNLREIGQQPGVAHLLEGSVQRATNRVRLNAQLIDARTDTHVWGQTYDRDLADVFASQSEIAKAIAEQLQARISPRENEAISNAPTTDLIASKLYTQARDRQSAGNDPKRPDYAAAWGVLGVIDAGLGRKDEAVREVKHACELLPVSRDTFIGPALVTNLAVIYAWTGEKDSALAQLSISSQIPSGVTYGELKLDPQ
ncbi:MAG: hypothetical protein DLM52_10220 [Chthoniobacterales bacterium]|nr:MAG: hypothetical protein DLM52_10220 [Chthoniobacterales bacterium]